MSPAILGMSYRWVTSISWTIRPCGNSRRIYWIAVKFPWLEFCLLLWMHHLFCTGLLPFVCSGVHDMEGKGGWASDCLTWWLDLTFLWRLFSGPHDKKRHKCVVASLHFNKLPFHDVFRRLDCDVVMMCLCSSRGHDHHGTALVLPRLSFQAKSSCLKQYIIMSNAWRLGDVKVSCIVCSTRRNLHDLGGYIPCASWVFVWTHIS